MREIEGERVEKIEGERERVGKIGGEREKQTSTLTKAFEFKDK